MEESVDDEGLFNVRKPYKNTAFCGFVQTKTIRGKEMNIRHVSRMIAFAPPAIGNRWPVINFAAANAKKSTGQMTCPHRTSGTRSGTLALMAGFAKGERSCRFRSSPAPRNSHGR
jgi:hypothetical protein